MKNSTFRENRLTIPATTPTQYSEGNTRPNWFLFVNNSATYIYVGVSPNVSTSVFEMIVPPYGTRSYARPDAPLEVWLFASGQSSLYVASMEKDFDPNMIAQTQEIAAVNASGLLGTVDVNSVLNALPAGTNALGTVEVTALPSIPAGGNAIGTVQVTSLPALPAGSNALGSVAVSSLPADKGAVTTAHNAISASADSSEINCTGFNALLVQCSVSDITSGNWVVEVKGCLETGGSVGSIIYPQDNASPALTMKHISPAMDANGVYVMVFKGIPNFVKIAATRTTDGTLTCKVQPIKL